MHSFLKGEDYVPTLKLADDEFYLFELYGKFFRPQLVVLSACRTGHGILAEGEGIISLARGFTASGARGIVAGLWNIQDESTAALLGEFYHQLSEKSQPSLALHRAKLKWLDQLHGKSFYKLPYFWAGLIYVGNDQKVGFQKRYSVSVIWWIVGAMVIIASGCVLIKKKKAKVV